MTDLTRDQIERLRDGWAATGWLSTDDAIALFDHAISEQSRIDAAVAMERERCAHLAGNYVDRNNDYADKARRRGNDRLEVIFESRSEVAAEIRDCILLPPGTGGRAMNVMTEERPDFNLMLLREKYAVPPGWEVFRWEIKNHGTPNVYMLLTGAVVSTTYKSGPRKGRPNWKARDKSTEMSLPITEGEQNEFKARWEAETGKCRECGGVGTVWAGWSKAEGTKWRTCKRCDGTGIAPSRAGSSTP